jgi:hypothetical protein
MILQFNTPNVFLLEFSNIADVVERDVLELLVVDAVGTVVSESVADDAVVSGTVVEIVVGSRNLPKY